MAHIVREIVRPGQYIFKVYGTKGSLMYHGSSEDTAIGIKASLENLEEKRAREARKIGSGRSSD